MKTITIERIVIVALVVFLVAVFFAQNNQPRYSFCVSKTESGRTVVFRFNETTGQIHLFFGEKTFELGKEALDLSEHGANSGP